jgi:hypothetical protein
MSTRIVWIDRVKRVEEKIARQWVRGSADKAEFREESHGWWVTLESGHEAIYVGTTRPELRAGDSVRRILEKV